ncbi:MAG: DUF4328 domain-containing protein, partial [Marmoricola sp.]
PLTPPGPPMPAAASPSLPAPAYPPPASPPQGYPPPPYPQSYPQPGYPHQTYPQQPPAQQSFPAQPYPPAAFPPYGQYGYGTPWVAPQPRARRVRGYAIAAIVASALLAGVQVAGAIAAWPSGASYADAWNRGDNADFTAAWDVTGYFYLPLVPLAYVLGSLWLWHVRTNAPLISTEVRQGLPRGWAWGGWITPVVWFWFPLQLVRDTFRASVPGARATLTLSAWWALFGAWLLTEPWASSVVFDQAPGDRQLLGIVETAEAALCLGALYFWLRLVVRITRAQDSWFDGRETAVGSESPLSPAQPWNAPQP